MTPYERGYAAALKAAAELCKVTADLLPPGPFTGLCAETLQSAEQRILSLPIVGEATDPGEQELPAAAAKALPSASRVSTSDRDATEGTSAQQPARPGPSQECVSVPFSIAYHLESMSLEMGGKCHICSQFRSLLAAAKEE